MTAAYLDTHVVVYLHAGLTESLSVKAKRQIESSDLLISPIVNLELDYLRRRNRIAASPRTILQDLGKSIGLAVCRLPFATVCEAATNIDWTNDPFDKLIVAQAAANRQAPLISADRVIRANYANCVW